MDAPFNHMLKKSDRLKDLKLKKVAVVAKRLIIPSWSIPLVKEDNLFAKKKLTKYFEEQF